MTKMEGEKTVSDMVLLVRYLFNEIKSEKNVA